MKSETLVQQHPPTPPGIGPELQTGFRQLTQFNADGGYPYDDSHGVGYGSPGSLVYESLPQHSSHAESHAETGFGVGIQYDEHNRGSAYHQEGHYHGLPNNQAMFSGSPPTPRSATEEDESGGRTTRSGRTIAPSSSPHVEEKPRPKATPKSKKAKTGKGEKPKTPKLTAPLSVLTKDMVAIPVRNMEEWVNRSAEVRRKEVEKRNGYVTRPMNSFMLYRSAYAERTKQWCLQNNHQIVSSVSGESWPLEPPEVRELYNEYAKIERINHQNAHPTYKFSPSKATPPSRKRKGEYSDDDEPSDLDDAEWAPGHVRSRMRHSRRPDRALSYPSHGMSTEYYDRSFGSNGTSMNKSTWEMANDGRPMPMPMAHNDVYNQYFQTSVHPNMAMGPVVMEDLRMRRVDTPIPSMGQFTSGHALLGLPGGNAADLMQHLHSQAGTPLDEPQVDPMLLAFDGSHNPEFQNGHMGIIERELEQDNVNSLLEAARVHDEYESHMWQPGSNMAPMEHESEFEKWMGEH